MTLELHLLIPLQVAFVSDVGPSAQQGLRAKVRDEIKERKGKGKGNRKQTPKKAPAAASSGSNHDGDRCTKGKGKGKGKQPKVAAGKGRVKPGADPKPNKKSKTCHAGSTEHANPFGCPTCRYSANGCRICRRPGYKARGPNKRSTDKKAESLASEV